MFGHVNIFIQNIVRFFLCISSLCIINFILIGGNQRSTNEKKKARSWCHNYLFLTQATQAHYSKADVTLACEQCCVTNRLQ